MSDADGLETDAPDVPHKGLNVVDFDHPGVGPAIRKAVRLLPPAKRRLLYVAAGIQVSLGLLDLLGIVLIGLVAAIAVSGISQAQLPSWVQTLLDTIGLGGLTISQLSVVVALAAVTILVLKTLMSALLSRRIIRFLANRQAEVSSQLARDFLSRPLSDVQRWTTPEAMYALGAGVGAAR